MNVANGLLLAALLLRWHPLALFAIVLSALRIARRPLAVVPEAAARTLLWIASILCLTTFAAYLAWYVAVPEFSDHLEPTLGALTEVFRRGEPLYHPLDAAPRHAMLYGPILYPIRAAFVAALGPGPGAVKLPGVLACLAALLLLHVALRAALPPLQSVATTAVVASACAAFGPIAYFGKADPLMFCCSSAALLAAVRAPRAPAILFCALGLGCATNIKPPAALNFLPALWLLHSRFGVMCALQSCVAGACVALLPFAVFPQASLPDYLRWLGSAGAHGIDTGILARNLEWTAVLLAPLVLLARRESLPPIALVALTFLVSSIAGSKAGGGIGHLLPLLPASAYLAAVLAARREPREFAGQIALALAITCLTVGVPHQVNVAVALRARAAADAYGDLHAFLAANPGKRVQIGYGTTATYHLADHRLWLVQAGHPYSIDAGALMDMAGANVPWPDATNAAMRSDSTDVWLLPRGDEPFALGCWYPPFARLFPPAFRDAFHARYRRTGATRLFDVWTRADLTAP